MISVPFCSLKFTHDEIKHDVEKAFATVYNRGQFITGSELSAFESEFAAYNGIKYCVGLASGLDALQVSLQLVGVGVGDEVIVPAYTYIASWLAVSHVGATIVPVDVDPNTMLMDVAQVAKAISSRTKAIMPVHLYGRACDMDSLTLMARRHNVILVEDNAQAHGAKFGANLTGSFGECNATSFYPTKNLGALGDGGAITTNKEEIYAKALQLRNYGSSHQFVNPVKGINSRLDELQAGILRVKLRHLDDWNRERTKVAAIYQSNLDGIGDITLPPSNNDSADVFHLYVIRTKYREALRSFLFKKGIGTMIHYPIPPHLQEAYAELNFRKGDFPVSEQLSETVLSLPIWPGLSNAQQAWVIEKIKEFYDQRFGPSHP